MYEANKQFQGFLFFTLDTSQSFQLPSPHLLVSFIAYPKKIPIKLYIMHGLVLHCSHFKKNLAFPSGRKGIDIF